MEEKLEKQGDAVGMNLEHLHHFELIAVLNMGQRRQMYLFHFHHIAEDRKETV